MNQQPTQPDVNQQAAAPADNMTDVQAAAVGPTEVTATPTEVVTDTPAVVQTETPTTAAEAQAIETQEAVNQVAEAVVNNQLSPVDYVAALLAYNMQLDDNQAYSLANLFFEDYVNQRLQEVTAQQPNISQPEM